MSKCPVCGKKFVILYPHLWAYKLNKQMLCSWKCLRIRQNRKLKGWEKPMKGNQKITLEIKKKAVETAIAGGDPLDVLKPYSTNPKSMWTYIRKCLKEKDPELFAKIPDRREWIQKAETPEKIPAEIVQKAVEELPAVEICPYGAPEAPAVIRSQDNLLSFKILELETPLARYIMKDGDLMIHPEDTPEGIRLCAEECRQLIRELPKVMEILGVI